MVRRPRIVHLSSVHRADDVRIFHKEARSLAAAGFDVTLIARAGANADRTVDGVTVRALNPRSGNRFVRMTRSVLDVLQAARRERGDAYHLHDPELLPVGVALKLMGRRVVFDSHEHVAKQIRSKPWIPNWARAPVAAVYAVAERASIRLFDGVVAATPGVAEAFPGTDTVVVQNFVMASEFGQADGMSYQHREPQIAYVGGLTEARGVVEMVRAMEQVDGGARATLVLAGAFAPSSLQQHVEELPGWKQVRYLGWLGRAEVVDVLGKSRVGLLTLHPEPNYIDSWPVKLFEYMLAGLPVVASGFPFWEQFILEAGAGIMVDPLDPQAIADAIGWLLDHPDEAEAMGRRGREAVLARYTWESQAENLVEFYRTKVFA